MSTWETFLPVVDPSKQDLAPAADAAWCLQKGIEPEAPALLVQLRDEVLPLIRRLEREHDLSWYSFLIHAYDIVPTAPDDKRAFIHLRLRADDDRDNFVLPPAWLWTRKVELSHEIAGVDTSVLDVDEAWRIIGDQSAWLLDFIEAHHSGTDPLTLTKHVKQFLHFWANQCQMRVA